MLDENGERIRLASGRYKTRKVDLVDWNSLDNAEVWRKAWADLANSFLKQSNHPERIDHRSYERQGIEQIPTVHIGVAASQMEKKGIVTERGELNRSIKTANPMLREIRAQIKKLKEWLSGIFKAKEALRAELQQPKSPDLSTLLFRYLDIQKQRAGSIRRVGSNSTPPMSSKPFPKRSIFLRKRASSLWRNWTLPCPLSAIRQAKSVAL